ncbi:MAG: hypothetical protein U0Z44_21970 [Kouleothrix sp.]
MSVILRTCYAQVRLIDDPTPFLFSASGAFMFFATRHYQLLDLTPIAQQEIRRNARHGRGRSARADRCDQPTGRAPAGRPSRRLVGQTLDAIGIARLARCSSCLPSLPGPRSWRQTTRSTPAHTWSKHGYGRSPAGARAPARWCCCAM